ncbi:tryptophan-rich sensory protein [Candidatus Woesebacteria bacterium]|nr:tryptophan-rich sensory protein [Candidatus Woesebacteria bacterium]
MKKNIFLKLFVAFTYVCMIAANALANILPINGNNTGEVSNAYPNLFAPASVTFSIWGIIYFLLAAYTLYQFGLFQKDWGKSNAALFQKIGLFFSISSVANILWIVSWHYRFIGVSLVLMLVILFYLIKIADVLKTQQFSNKELFFIRAPFGIYFGWITVATIANVTTFLVSSNWNGFGLSDQVWMLIVLVVGAVIGIVRTIKDKNVFYGSVLIWAYLGILLKHTSATEFNFQYPMIINLLIVCLISFGVTNGWVLLKKRV